MRTATQQRRPRRHHPEDWRATLRTAPDAAIAGPGRGHPARFLRRRDNAPTWRYRQRLRNDFVFRKLLNGQCWAAAPMLALSAASSSNRRKAAASAAGSRARRNEESGHAVLPLPGSPGRWWSPPDARMPRLPAASAARLRGRSAARRCGASAYLPACRHAAPPFDVAVLLPLPQSLDRHRMWILIVRHADDNDAKTRPARAVAGRPRRAHRYLCPTAAGTRQKSTGTPGGSRRGAKAFDVDAGSENRGSARWIDQATASKKTLVIGILEHDMSRPAEQHDTQLTPPTRGSIRECPGR